MSAVVTALPGETGLSAWDACFRPQRLFPSLERDESCDFLVIGAGYAGLSAARALRLDQPGARIIVLEALRVGQGAAGRNAGFMIDVTHDLGSDDYAGEAHADRQTMRENRLAIDFALAAAVDYDFEQGIMVRSGKINAACSERSLALARRYAAHLRKLGEPCTELDGDDLARITGSPYYTGGVHTPGTVMIQPYRLHQEPGARPVARWRARAGMHAGAGAGVRARPRRAHGGGDDPRRQDHPGYQRSCARLRPLPTPADGHHHLRVHHGAAIRRPGARAGRRGGLVPHARRAARLHRAAGARRPLRRRPTLFRSLFKATGLGAASARLLARAQREHRIGIQRRYPVLKDVTLSHSWAGRLCLSTNAGSAVAEVETGVVTACCQNGLGTVRGTFNGMLAARITLGLPTDGLAPGGWRQPARVPPQPLLRPALNAYLSWKRHEDAHEC
ncbi:FAD-dependent oxidoreductase [Achromobacter xylosoxidans]